MSQELSPENKLYAMVMDYKHDVLHGTKRFVCALQRASYHMKTDGEVLTLVGKMLGFTETEAWGVMYGWDRAAGTMPNPHTCPNYLGGERRKDPEAFARGERVGQKCAFLAGVSR